MMPENITEHKKAKMELPLERDSLINFLKSMEDGVYLSNINYDVEFINPSLVKEFGQYEGKKCYNYFADLEEVCPRCKAQEVFKGKTLRREWYSDKNQKIYDIFETPIKNADDSFSKLAILRDITERKKTENRLKESEEMYRNLFNSTPYAIWLVDLKGTILDCNEPMNKFMSVFKHTDLIGRPFREVLQMFLREGDPRFENLEKVLKERFKILLKKGYLKPIEFEISRGDGKTFWITLESSFVNVGKNRLIQTFIKDITERKLAEIELDGLRKELELRIRERTIKLQSSEKKYRKAYNRAYCYKGLFTHDISNMFHTIGNSIELCEMLLKEGVKNNDMVEYFKAIEQQIKRGKKLINNIKSLSEIEESEMPLEPTEILEKLRSAIQFVKVNFQKRKIDVKIKSEANKICVLANDLLLDVFENILLNSIQYNKNETAEIEIKVSRMMENEKKHIKLEFKDNGIGINDTRKKSIFNKTVKKSVESKGMGLGLSLVAKLIDLCEGKIWVEDRIKGDYIQGCNFIIQIPEAL